MNIHILDILAVAPPFRLAWVPAGPIDLRPDASSWLHIGDVTRSGQTVPVLLTTGRLDMGSEVLRKRFQSLDLTADAVGCSVRADLSLNGNNTRLGSTLNLGLHRASEDAVGNGWLVWTRGTWDDWKWGELSVASYDIHRRLPVHAKGIDAQLSLSTPHAQDLKLAGIDLFYITIGGVY
jgi:hypothetical protein